MGLSSTAITGTITISREMNAGPPMKGVSGKNADRMKTEARHAVVVMSDVTVDPRGRICSITALTSIL
jgi:hypothetical protein